MGERERKASFGRDMAKTMLTNGIVRKCHLKRYVGVDFTSILHLYAHRTLKARLVVGATEVRQILRDQDAVQCFDLRVSCSL